MRDFRCAPHIWEAWEDIQIASLVRRDGVGDWSQKAWLFSNSARTSEQICTRWADLSSKTLQGYGSRRQVSHTRDTLPCPHTMGHHHELAFRKTTILFE